MRIVRKLKGWWDGVAFERLMRRRDRYFTAAEHARFQAECCEAVAKRVHPLRWHERQPQVRECFANLHAGEFSIRDALGALDGLEPPTLAASPGERPTSESKP